MRPVTVYILLMLTLIVGNEHGDSKELYLESMFCFAIYAVLMYLREIRDRLDKNR